MQQHAEYYIAVIRPVLEYCVPVWHHALTKEQSKQMEAIQKRAIHIIFNFTRGMPYTSMLYAANINTLAGRRQDICKRFSVALLSPLPVFISYSLLQESNPLLHVSDLFKNIQEYIRVLVAIAHLSIIP